jgi:hypothetical protein
VKQQMINSLLILLTQTTPTFLLCKLSCVNILPKAADQKKKATLVGALTHHIFF